MTLVRRFVFSSLIGLGATAAFLVSRLLLGNHLGEPAFAGDFFQIWTMLRALHSGVSPYVAGCPIIPPCADANQYYPVTAGLALWPLGHMTSTGASVTFVGVSAALLAFGITRDGRRRLPLFLSYPFVIAVVAGQWPPLIMAAALIPGAEWLYAAKPQLGMALFAAKPNARSILLGSTFFLASLALSPTWPLEWWRVAAGSPYVRSPILRFAWFAPVLLLAGLRWRTAEGRLLLMLALVPQTPFAYDQLLLWFIPRTEREALNLTWFSWAMFGAWYLLTYRRHTELVVLWTFAPYVVLFLFIPCLFMVLRRPNEFLHSERG